MQAGEPPLPPHQFSVIPFRVITENFGTLNTQEEGIEKRDVLRGTFQLKCYLPLSVHF